MQIRVVSQLGREAHYFLAFDVILTNMKSLEVMVREEKLLEAQESSRANFIGTYIKIENLRMNLKSLHHLFSPLVSKKIVLDKQFFQRFILLEHFQYDLHALTRNIVPAQVEALDR